MRISNAVIEDNEDKLDNLGVNLGEFGSHSTQMGYTAMFYDGCTVTTPMASIFLRGFWFMGPVKYRYH